MEETFAARLRQLRENADVSQAELARRAGMNQFTIAKLEQGKREPSLATAQALARALGLSLSTFDDVILGGQESEQPEGEKKKPGRPRKAAPARGNVAPAEPNERPSEQKPRKRK